MICAAGEACLKQRVCRTLSSLRDTTELCQTLKQEKEHASIKMSETEEELVQARLRHSERFIGLSAQLHRTMLQQFPEDSMELDNGFDSALQQFHKSCSQAADDASKPAPSTHSCKAAEELPAASQAAQSQEDMPAPATRNEQQAKQTSKLVIQGWRRRELFNERERSRMSVAVGQTVDLLLALHSHDPAAAVDALWALQDAEKQTIHELQLVEKSASGAWDPPAPAALPEWLAAQLKDAGLAEAFECDGSDKSLFCCQSVMQGIPDDVQDEWLGAFQPPTREQAAEKLASLVAQHQSQEHQSGQQAEDEHDEAAQSVAKRRRTGQEAAAGAAASPATAGSAED